MKPIYIILLSFFSQSIQAQTLAFDSLNLLSSQIIYFDSGKYDLRASSDSTLLELAQRAKSSEKIVLHIRAHTDSRGTNEFNQELSQNRADTTKRKLLEYGILDSILIIQPFGELQPVAENTTDEGRQKNRRVTIDLYQKTAMVYLSGTIKDKESGEGIEAKVVIRQKNKRDSIDTNKDGSFKFPIPDQSVVGIDVYAPEYFFETQMFKADASKIKEIKVELPKIKEGAKVDIKNLYFVGNQAILLKRSEKELPKLLKFMEINPNIKVEIAGHINRPFQEPVHVESWNYNLSVRRAETVYSYLRRNGISSDRITYKGYGNWEMRYPRARSEKEQELNRRVEIKILDTGEQLGKIGKDGY